MRMALLAILFLLMMLSLFVGNAELSPVRLLKDPEAWQLLADSRVPRTAAAVLTGAALAVTGQVMQMISRNRFVEPMTAGTGQSAALGILLVTLLWPSASVSMKMAGAAFIALLGSVGFFQIVRQIPPTQPFLIPLVGLIYGGIIGAGTTLIAYQADLLQFIDIWMTGEFSGTMRERYEFLWLAALAAGFCYLIADQFAILGLGPAVSLNLGLNYRQVSMLGLLAISLVTAITVVTVGLIPFVGLVVPNIVSRFRGDNLRATLPITALGGALLVLLADILGRVLRYPFEIPAGTTIAILGAGFFLWLLFSRPRHA